MSKAAYMGEDQKDLEMEAFSLSCYDLFIVPITFVLFWQLADYEQEGSC